MFGFPWFTPERVESFLLGIHVSDFALGCSKNPGVPAGLPSVPSIRTPAGREIRTLVASLEG